MTWKPDARFIGPAEPDGSAPRISTRFRREGGHGRIVKARLRASALGVYELELNGRPVSEDVLAPGWSSYEWRLKYQTYEVMDLLSEVEEQELAAVVGNGWYLGQLGWQQRHRLYGTERGVLIELDITYEDGHLQQVRTDESWTAQGTGTLADDLYDGQTVDFRARKLQQGPVKLLTTPAELVDPQGPAVRRQERLRPQRIWSSPAGRTLVDFGQNLVGWLRFTVRGEPGQEIVLRHAEVLEEGELGVRPLRNAAATDRLILSGGEDRFEPTFTFHGFRYAEVTGWPGELRAEDLEAVVVHSEIRRTGHFACSDERLNQLHSNVVWGMRGNFLEVPTDCPQRDERLGWTGDIAVFAPTAAYLYDVRDFLADWLEDVHAEQRHAEGYVPFVVPDVLKYQDLPKEFPSPESAAVWSDAAVWVPWALWTAYGDREVLVQQYESIASHMRRVASLLSSSGLWDEGFQFGDWLDPDASPHEPHKAKADPGVVATACVYRSARMAAEIAALLGHEGDSEEFSVLACRVRQAFQEHYVDGKSRIVSDSTTVYTLAIVFGLLTEEQRECAGDRLADLVQQAGYRVSTGFAGTPYITDALSSTGHVETAYRLLLETECPSWLYPVTMGATTVWERWDSMLPDGSINPGEMTSFNHYALGSVADWMHRVIGGITPAEPGYSRIRIAPRPPQGSAVGMITWAESSVETSYGVTACRWELDGAEFRLEVEVPQGTTAELDVPDAPVRELASGRHEISVPRK